MMKQSYHVSVPIGTASKPDTSVAAAGGAATALSTIVKREGRTSEEIQAQWYDPTYWTSLHGLADEIDVLIERFNERVGL